MFGFRQTKQSTIHQLKSPTKTPSKPTHPKHYKVNAPPLVLPTISASEVKRRTGFINIQHSLAYIIIVVNGDINAIAKKQTPLTWFEEWIFYFEWSYHQTMHRQEDYTANWVLDHHQMNAVKDSKLCLELASLLSWPNFASYKEDLELRDDSKWSRYNSTRPIFWDMTNVSAVCSLVMGTFKALPSVNIMARIAGNEVLVCNYVAGFLLVCCGAVVLVIQSIIATEDICKVKSHLQRMI